LDEALTVRIVLLADAYSPLRSSGAVLLRDLASEMSGMGHEIHVVVPSYSINSVYEMVSEGTLNVLRVRVPRVKDTGKFRRALLELLLPYFLLRGMRKSSLKDVTWNAIIWYSPTIFLGPAIARLKRSSNCKTYLILRDIFPQWAVDVGLLKKGLIYQFFRKFELYQYRIADVIGVQSASNLKYFEQQPLRRDTKIEVLQNWLAPAPVGSCSISVENSRLRGRKLVVYCGNMGVAQDMGFIMEAITLLQPRKDIGFLFVGRGSEVRALETIAEQRGLDNIQFYDEIDPEMIPGLLDQCDVGLVALDPRHKTHNVPGKFLAYMQAGLPVVARLNPDNDLEKLIRDEQVGLSYSGEDPQTFSKLIEQIIRDENGRGLMASRANSLSHNRYSVSTAAGQILGSLAICNGEAQIGD